MTEATELAMNLAQLKLQLRKLAGPHVGKSPKFDAAVQVIVDGLNEAILESVDAVHAPAVKQ
jgi:hypothetical protein